MERILPIDETFEVELALKFSLCFRYHELISPIARTVVKAANKVYTEARTWLNRTTLHDHPSGSLVHLSHCEEVLIILLMRLLWLLKSEADEKARKDRDLERKGREWAH